MEYEIKNYEEKVDNINSIVPFYKKKIIVIPLVSMFIITLITAGYFLAPKTHLVIGANESIIIDTPTISFSGYPGEHLVVYTQVTNKGSVPLEITLVYNETSNINNITYEVSTPTLMTVPGVNNIAIDVDIYSDTNPGSAEGDISYIRL